MVCRSALLMAAACLVVFLTGLESARAYEGSQKHDEPPDLALTLRDSIVLALRNNRTLVNARLKRAVDRFSLDVAENEFRPAVTVKPYMTRERVTETMKEVNTTGVMTDIALRVPTGGDFALGWRVSEEDDRNAPRDRGPGALTLRFTQPLLRRGGVDVGTAPVRIARLTEEINLLAFRSTIMSIISSVSRLYRSYLQAGRKVDISTRSLERARDLLVVNRLLVEAGRMAEREIVQAQADIARRELDLIAAQNRLDAARLNLIDVLDIDSRTRIQGVDELKADSVPVDVDRSIKIAFENRPDYLSAKLGLENAETRETVARNGLLWDLDLSFSTSFTRRKESYRDALSGLDKSGYNVGLELSIPVGAAAGDPRKLEHLRAMTALRTARNNLEDLRQQVDIEVHNAVRETELSLRQVELARKAREFVERKTEIEREKLSLGVSTNFQLVSFENDLVAAENNELDATIAYLNALTELDQTLGTTLDTWGIDVEDVESDGQGGS